MSEDTKNVSDKKEKPPAPKKQVVVPKKSGDVVKVENISKYLVNTSKGSIEPGEKGKCTLAESRSYGKSLKVI